MGQPYSAWADWLSKFHTWSEPIQALWLVSVPVTLLGMTRITMRGIRDILQGSRRDGSHPSNSRDGDAQARIVLDSHEGRSPLFGREGPPPELIGRGTAMRRPTGNPQE